MTAPASPRTALVVAPHADDAAAFCGGTLAKFAAEGWRVVLLRVTDDRTDSVGLSCEETIRRNAEELREAARILGVAEIVELGFETDRLADVPETALRERFVYFFRKHRPYAVFSFDPFGLYEGNMDHVRVAQAVEEAFWTACFDLHHPEHFAEGLEPFSVCERWYFARRLPETNHVEEIGAFLGRKIAAMRAHATMTRNIANQLRLQLRTYGRRAPAVDAAVESDAGPLLEMFFRAQAAEVARAAGLPAGSAAEAFRLVRFGDLEDLVRAASEPIPGAPPSVARKSLGD